MATVPSTAVARRADGDYDQVNFICPTNGRAYASVRPPQAYRTRIGASCYWCDADGHVRGDRDFDAKAPECHLYDLEDDR